MSVGRLRLALAGGLVASLALMAGASADFVWDLETIIDPPESNDAFGRAVVGRSIVHYDDLVG